MEVGNNNAYIEEVRTVVPDKTRGSTALEIQIRYPLDSDDTMIEGLLKTYAKKWLAESRVAVTESR